MSISRDIIFNRIGGGGGTDKVSTAITSISTRSSTGITNVVYWWGVLFRFYSDQARFMALDHALKGPSRPTCQAK